MTDDLDDGDDGDDVRVVATPAALAAIDRLRAGLGDPVMFVQSGGCCAGSTPMCFPDGEFVVGDEDVLLGLVGGCPFYIDRRLDVAWHQDRFVLDVAEGEPEGFSLAAGAGIRFVTRASGCALTATAPTQQRTGP